MFSLIKQSFLLFLNLGTWINVALHVKWYVTKNRNIWIPGVEQGALNRKCRSFYNIHNILGESISLPRHFLPFNYQSRFLTQTKVLTYLFVVMIVNYCRWTTVFHIHYSLPESQILMYIYSNTLSIYYKSWSIGLWTQKQNNWTY